MTDEKLSSPRPNKELGSQQNYTLEHILFQNGNRRVAERYVTDVFFPVTGQSLHRSSSAGRKGERKGECLLELCIA